ncbi:MFS transporter [Nocardia sp. NPDC051832]|uniref:MFS transporter n=1 Tax=Nocardia sp. NPDC051832 TaxID=3155673 RepID=UPI00343BACEC
MTTTAPPRATIRDWIGLGLLTLPMLALAADLTVLFFALPTISLDLKPNASQVLWITHAYGFLIAGFLVTAGRVSDRIGPRRLLLIGSAAFAILSAVAAYSATAELLIATRAALGIAGATLMPPLFSLLRVMFRDDTQRRLAIAIAISAFTVGGAIGPVVGGILVEYFWWGSVFLINVPLLGVFLLAGVRLLPERAERNRTRIDPVSVVLSVSAMLLIVFGLQELAAGRTSGSGPVVPYLLALLTGLGVMVLFLRRQRRIAEPLFDLDLLRHRRVRVALLTLLLMGTSITGLFYLFTQFLMWVAGLSPLQAGLWTMPYIVLNIIGGMFAPGLARRWRPATVTICGVVIAASGALGLLALAGTNASLQILVAVFSTVGFGQAMAVALLSDLIIAGAPETKTGSAASAQEAGAELGTALGIAAAGVAGILAYRGYLSGNLPTAVPQPVNATIRSSIHDGVAATERLPELLAIVQDAIGFGLRTYAGIAAAILAMTAVLLLALRTDESAGAIPPREYAGQNPGGVRRSGKDQSGEIEAGAA